MSRQKKANGLNNFQELSTYRGNVQLGMTSFAAAMVIKKLYIGQARSDEYMSNPLKANIHRNKDLQ